jgi:2-methylcitrate dehydratase PrpD
MASIRERAVQVVSIDARIQTMTDAIVRNRNAHIYQLPNIEELQYSLPVQIALSALGKGNGYKTHRAYLEGRLPLTPDSDVIGLARRIKLAADNTLDEKYPRKFVADVTVQYLDGEPQHIFLAGAKGMPLKPLTAAEHQVKLDELTDELIGKPRSDELFAMIDRMEANRPTSALTALLGRP